MALIDWKFFVFFPLQKKIILDDDRTKMELKQLRKALQSNPDSDIYKLMYLSRNTRFWRSKRHSVSFMQIFEIEEVSRVIVSGAMRLSSSYLVFSLLQIR